MGYLKNVLTPINVLINLNEMGMVRSAREQLDKLCLGDLILITDNFTKHDRLNQIGEVLMDRLARAIKETDEYKAVEGGF